MPYRVWNVRVGSLMLLCTAWVRIPRQVVWISVLLSTGLEVRILDCLAASKAFATDATLVNGLMSGHVCAAVSGVFG